MPEAPASHLDVDDGDWRALSQLGRWFQDENRFDEADAAYRRALGYAANDEQTLFWLSELIWMRTADVTLARAPLDAAIRLAPGRLMLRLLRAKLMTAAGDLPGAYDGLVRAIENQPAGHIAAAQLAARFDAARGLWHAFRAHQLAPSYPGLATTLCLCHFAAGEPETAGQMAAAILRDAPDDQQAIALEALAWRLADDPRHCQLHDYQALVGIHDDLPVPLSQLAGVLHDMHRLTTHPFGQSARHGAKTQRSLLEVRHPAVQALIRAIDTPVRDHIGRLGAGDDPVRRRNTGGYALAEAWSVRLNPGGFHVDHVHPDGWLSCAVYVETPRAVDAGAGEGWLNFGRPGAPLPEPLDAELSVKPLPGRLVIFPSCMWHGTTPFGGDERRLAVGFDLLPAPPA